MLSNALESVATLFSGPANLCILVIYDEPECPEELL